MLSPTSQYFSTTLRPPTNLSLTAQSFEAFTSDSTVITIVDPLPFPDSNCSSNRFSFINHYGVVLNFIPVEDLISQQISSIFPSPR